MTRTRATGKTDRHATDSTQPVCATGQTTPADGTEPFAGIARAQ